MNFVTDTHALIWWFTDSPILQKMIALKEIPELHDKIIISTAKHLNLPIITKDKSLRNLTSIKTIW
jgi:PIN domain nuclease of toxin-antitoxin system